MNVKELKELLSQVDENMEVLIDGHDQGVTDTRALGVKDVVVRKDGWSELLEDATRSNRPPKNGDKIETAFVLLY